MVVASHLIVLPGRQLTLVLQDAKISKDEFRKLVNAHYARMESVLMHEDVSGFKCELAHTTLMLLMYAYWCVIRSAHDLPDPPSENAA